MDDRQKQFDHVIDSLKQCGESGEHPSEETCRALLKDSEALSKVLQVERVLPANLLALVLSPLPWVRTVAWRMMRNVLKSQTEAEAIQGIANQLLGQPETKLTLAMVHALDGASGMVAQGEVYALVKKALTMIQSTADIIARDSLMRRQTWTHNPACVP
eukprot:gene725-1189_t